MRYTDQKVETYFTLFSVKLFPLGGASGYVECATCKSTYNHEVLDYDPHKDASEFQSTFEIAVLKSMVLMMVSDGVSDLGELSAIRDIYRRMTGRPITDTQIESLAKDISSSRASLRDYVGNVSSQLNVGGKEMVVRALYMVAMADGSIAPQEQRLLDAASSALDISPERVRAVIAETDS